MEHNHDMTLIENGSITTLICRALDIFEFDSIDNGYCITLVEFTEERHEFKDRTIETFPSDFIPAVYRIL
jgi:hypothetical protein